MPVAKPAAPAPELHSWDDVDQVLALLPRMYTRKSALEDSQTRRLQTVKDEIGPKLKEQSADIEAAEQALSAFVLAHRAEVTEEGGKTLTLRHGAVKLRTSPPKLVTIGRTTWPQVLERVTSLLTPRFQRKFVVTEEKLDKNAIKESILADELPDDKRKALGLAVEQGEEVYYELAAEQPV